MLHIRHTAEHGQHALRCAGKAECPRGHAALGRLLLQFHHQILRQLHQSAAQQGFHDDGRYASLLQFGIEVAGVDVVLADHVGKVPVQVVQLYLHKVPMILLVGGDDLVEDILQAVEREAQVAYASCLTLLHQEVHDAVVDVASLELVHVAAHGVQQVVVDVVDLQLAHRVEVHLTRLLERPEVAVEVRQLRGHVVRLARMALQGYARAALRLALTVDGTRVEVVQPVLQGVVHLAVDHVLVELVAVVHLRRQSHHAVAEQRHLVARLGVRAVGHLAHGGLHLVLILIANLLGLLVLAACQHSSRSYGTCA